VKKVEEPDEAEIELEELDLPTLTGH